MPSCRRFPILVALLFAFPILSVHADQRYVLTSAQHNIHQDTWRLGGGRWSVEKKTLHGGKQEGVDLITIDNGVMQIVVIPTRGMSIYEVRSGEMHWSAEQLPYLTIWKNTAATEDGYVTGIEPATGYPFNRKVERAADRVPKLSSGQKRRFTLDIGLHRGAESVQAAVQHIVSLQGDRQPEVKREPPGC